MIGTRRIKISLVNNLKFNLKNSRDNGLSNLKQGYEIMEVVDIGRLYDRKKTKVTMTAEVPKEVYILMLALFDEAYYYGLQGLSFEEYIGALAIAGICMSTEKNKWELIIPVYKEELDDYL